MSSREVFRDWKCIILVHVIEICNGTGGLCTRAVPFPCLHNDPGPALIVRESYLAWASRVSRSRTVHRSACGIGAIKEPFVVSVRAPLHRKTYEKVTSCPTVQLATGSPSGPSISAWKPLQGNDCWPIGGYALGSPFSGIMSRVISWCQRRGGGYPTNRWQLALQSINKNNFQVMLNFNGLWSRNSDWVTVKGETNVILC